MRDQKASLLKAVRPLDPAACRAGPVSRLSRRRRACAPDSTVETFIAVKLFIDSWRWEGVPIYIRAGKNLPVTATEVPRPVPASAARDVRRTRAGRLRAYAVPAQPRYGHRHGLAGQAAGRTDGRQRRGADADRAARRFPAALSAAARRCACKAKAICSGARTSSMRNGASWSRPGRCNATLCL